MEDFQISKVLIKEASFFFKIKMNWPGFLNIKPKNCNELAGVAGDDPEGLAGPKLLDLPLALLDIKLFCLWICFSSTNMLNIETLRSLASLPPRPPPGAGHCFS